MLNEYLEQNNKIFKALLSISKCRNLAIKLLKNIIEDCEGTKEYILQNEECRTLYVKLFEISSSCDILIEELVD